MVQVVAKTIPLGPAIAHEFFALAEARGIPFTLIFEANFALVAVSELNFQSSELFAQDSLLFDRIYTFSTRL
jgi:hypothetical protein